MPFMQAAASLADVETLLDATCLLPDAQDRLAELLSERAPIYDGRGSPEAEQIRGAVFVRLGTIGVPDAAMPFLLEELETGPRPYVVAAAARALRRAAVRSDGLSALLLAAAGRLRHRDDMVRFAGDDPAAAPTSALAELFRTIGSLGSLATNELPVLRSMADETPPLFSAGVVAEIEAACAAIARSQPPAEPSCCARSAPAVRSVPRRPNAGDLLEIGVQDQDGRVSDIGGVFLGRPGLIAFFYTRCMNPDKCSLTITKLGRLRRRLVDHGWDECVTLAAVTYDPAFDVPARLRAYGEARGVHFGPRCRLLRTTGPFQSLRDHFDLDVGYGPTTVNQHRLDLVVLDGSCDIVQHLARAQWSEDDAFDAILGLIGGRGDASQVSAAPSESDEPGAAGSRPAQEAGRMPPSCCRSRGQ